MVRYSKSVKQRTIINRLARRTQLERPRRRFVGLRSRRYRNTNLRTLQKGQHLHNSENWVHQYDNFYSEDNQTRYQRLWHDAKSAHPDNVILIKESRICFLVLNQDADIFNTEFGQLYMKGAIAQCLFPASCLENFQTKLTAKGYTHTIVELD